MNYILFDDAKRVNLLPLTFVRPVADIRIGILTIREKWEMYLGTQTSTLTESYLSKKYPIIKDSSNILINGAVCPTADLVKRIKSLKQNQALTSTDYIIALHVDDSDLDNLDAMIEKVDGEEQGGIEEIEIDIPHIKIDNPWDVFSKNGEAIKQDFELITSGRKSQEISSTNTAVNPDQVFIEKGAKIEHVILNASSGPIYVGSDAEIMEGSIIRGPFALCEQSTVKMGAKIYGPTTIGPHSKVGGELNNVVIFGYSNKAHDGFLGNSVLAEWCNLGAGTNNSNLKNTYDEVKLWSYAQQAFIGTGLQFCGLIMGDHTKCGISTMFNTGTIIGVNANIFGAGFQRNFIPSFVWGGTAGFAPYEFEKAMDVARSVMQRRDIVLSSVDKDILRSVHQLTQKAHRN